MTITLNAEQVKALYRNNLRGEQLDRFNATLDNEQLTILVKILLQNEQDVIDIRNKEIEKLAKTQEEVPVLTPDLQLTTFQWEQMTNQEKIDYVKVYGNGELAKAKEFASNSVKSKIDTKVKTTNNRSAEQTYNVYKRYLDAGYKLNPAGIVVNNKGNSTLNDRLTGQKNYILKTEFKELYLKEHPNQD